MEYPSYTYPVGSLMAGSSLGNYHTFSRLTSETNMVDLWSSLDDQYYAGEWTIDFLIQGEILKPAETRFSPESQETLYRGGEGAGIEISKRFFLPFSTDRRYQDPPSVLQAAIFLVRITSLAGAELPVVIRQSLAFSPRPGMLFTKQPPSDQTAKKVQIFCRESAFEILTRGRTDEARVLGSSEAPRRHSISDESLSMEFESVAQPGKSSDLFFVLGYSPGGISEARRIHLLCRNARSLLEESRAGYSTLLSASELLTPDPLINRGIQWAKINSARVQHRYRAGEAFTNDPPQDIVVIRDLAWYVLGSDYITPEFSHHLLALAERHGFHEDGKLTEFIHANEERPELHDYKLNINDDTPLYVYALYHHALLCKEKDALARAFPLMKRACDYILSQMEEGLIRCDAEGTNVWGICGWRNIIEGYTLTGAVTEINAECYAALLCTCESAAHLGKSEEAQFYGDHARRLREAMASGLVSEKTGVYLLNVGKDGVRHHDLTGDLIFPVLFGAADAEMKKRILAKLTRDEIWSPFGARTVSRTEPDYDPDAGCQLMGGVWPNLTAWIALCSRNDDPARLVEGMRNIYAISESKRPADFVNVVPGEFPERLHGESFLSRGMAMSPWMPPTYVWVGMEGLLGVRPTLEGLEVNPCIPPGWNWIAVKHFPYKGTAVALFFYDGILYSNYPVKSPVPLKLGELVETSVDADSILCIALKSPEGIILFAASPSEARGTITVTDGKRRIRESIHLGPGEAKLMDLATKRMQQEPAEKER
jgi:mannosylglycerate hydrolase MGH1-like protein